MEVFKTAADCTLFAPGGLVKFVMTSFSGRCVVEPSLDLLKRLLTDTELHSHDSSIENEAARLAIVQHLFSLTRDVFGSSIITGVRFSYVETETNAAGKSML
jgi:hypothetical protein